MTFPSIRTTEPLYIVILRNNQQAESILKNWVRENKVDHAQINGNKMMLHHQQAFDRFRMTWSYGWDIVTIWDTWNRRHIYV